MDRKHDDDLFVDLVAFVRDQPHGIEPDTIEETWAKHASQLAAEDPTILDDQYRLLVAVGGWSPEGSGAVGSSRKVADPLSENQSRLHQQSRIRKADGKAPRCPAY